MSKQGVLHDYDLYANREESSVGVTCAICGREDTQFQWSDYSGEAMCTQCGCPYQLITEGNPYLNIEQEHLPVLRQYWEETGQFVCYGSMLGYAPGVKEFNYWLNKNYPELCEKEAL